MKPMHNLSTRIAPVVTSLWLGVAGCAAVSADAPPATPVTTSASVAIQAPMVPRLTAPVFSLSDAPQPKDPRLSDGQIASIASAFDKAEIDAGTLALTHADSADVKQFAEHVLSVHANAASKIRAVVDNQNIVESDSTLAEGVRRGDETESGSLTGESGSAFDRAFVASRLAHQQDALRLFDGTLIDDVLNPLLKEALVATRVEIVENIELAKRLLAALPTT
jgi:putative membrane protein